jgi:hypothetical protein
MEEARLGMTAGTTRRMTIRQNTNRNALLATASGFLAFGFRVPASPAKIAGLQKLHARSSRPRDPRKSE